MARQLGKKTTILLSAGLALILPFFVVGFDYPVISPIHEFGHLLACWILGVQVVKVNWSSVEAVPVADWRQNVVGFMGGFSAALVLCLAYVLISRMFKIVSERVAFHPRLPRIIASLSALIKAMIMVDIIAQATGGIVEGASLSVYHQIFGSMAFTYIITWAFSCTCLFWQLRKLRRT